MRLLATLLAFLAASNFLVQAETQRYRSVRLDERGQLHLVLSSGREFLPRKLPDQVAFTQPLLSQNHRTVGWLADYSDPGGTSPYSGTLVLYRSGHLLRKFSTGQTFWSWQFASRNSAVAYCKGPTHGGARDCELRSLISGHLLALWVPDDKVDPPVWAKGLRF